MPSVYRGVRKRGGDVWNLDTIFSISNVCGYGTLFAYGFVSGGPTSKQISKEVQDEHNRKNSSFDRFGVDADLSC